MEVVARLSSLMPRGSVLRLIETRTGSFSLSQDREMVHRMTCSMHDLESVCAG